MIRCAAGIVTVPAHDCRQSAAESPSTPEPFAAKKGRRGGSVLGPADEEAEGPADDTRPPAIGGEKASKSCAPVRLHGSAM